MQPLKLELLHEQIGENLALTWTTSSPWKWSQIWKIKAKKQGYKWLQGSYQAYHKLVICILKKCGPSLSKIVKNGRNNGGRNEGGQVEEEGGWGFGAVHYYCRFVPQTGIDAPHHSRFVKVAVAFTTQTGCDGWHHCRFVATNPQTGSDSSSLPVLFKPTVMSHLGFGYL